MHSPSEGLGSRLDRLSTGPFHRKLLLLVGAGALIDAFDIYLAGGVVAAMVDDGFATIGSSAVFVSSTFVGMTIGAAAGGLVGDRYGRKASYQVNLLLFGLASLAAAFAPTIEFLIAMRFLMGLGLGAELVVAMGLIGEFIPPGKRGRYAGLLSTIIAAGLPLASFAGLWVIPHAGWRYMFAIAGVGGLAVWVARKNLPESPRWLESQGRTAEAEAVVRTIENSSGPHTEESAPMAPTERVTAPPAQATLSALFGAGVRRRLGLAVAVIVTINATVYGFVSWLPTLMVQQGLSVNSSLTFTAVVSAGAVCGSLLCVFLADRITRSGGLAATSGLTVLLGIAFALSPTTGVALAIGVVLVGSVYLLVALGQFGYVPELFPTSLRLRGAGFASMSGRAVSIAMPFLTVALLQSLGVAGVIGVVVVANALLVAMLLTMRIETAGASLEAIAADIEGTSTPADRPVGTTAQRAQRADG